MTAFFFSPSSVVSILSIFAARAGAKHVYAIEVDPAWTWAYLKHLYEKKPTNLTWIFGRAEDVADHIKADVAVIATRSGHAAMHAVAERIAPLVLHVHGAA